MGRYITSGPDDGDPAGIDSRGDPQSLWLANPRRAIIGTYLWQAGSCMVYVRDVPPGLAGIFSAVTELRRRATTSRAGIWPAAACARATGLEVAAVNTTTVSVHLLISRGCPEGSKCFPE